MNTPLKTALLLSLIVSLSACSSNSITLSDNKNASKSKARSINAIKLSAIQSLSLITPQLAKHRVVLVGETHTSYSDHLNQLAIIKALHEKWGKNTSIGLEMIQQQYQPHLGKYIADKISERDMLHATQWYDRWRYGFRLYRPIFDYAKANNIPLVALNIPTELTKRVTKVGIAGLNKKDRAKLPSVIGRTDTKYNQRIKNVFSQHSHTSSKGFDKFLDAQLAWDEGMAYSASLYLVKNPSTRMIIIAGNGHIVNRDGIPNRLARLIKSKPAVVLNNYQGMLNSQQGDFNLSTEEQELPSIGLIGIHMKARKKQNGVIVEALSMHGAAKKAGVQENDVIVEMDGKSVRAIVDVRLLLENKIPDDVVFMKLKRKGILASLSFKLGSRKRIMMH